MIYASDISIVGDGFPFNSPKLTVFQSQLEAVDKATPRERIGSGKISPMTIHAPGPQVEAKKKMKIAMNAIWAFTAEMLLARLTSGSLGSG